MEQREGSDLAAVVSEPARRVGSRIGFLDGVRAVAVVLVVLHHLPGRPLGESLGIPVNLGTAGVLAFFLCSGFIIPASLVRVRSTGRFWVNRFFRLWPMYLVAFALYNAAGAWSGFPAASHHSVVGLGVDLVMLSAQLGEVIVVGPSWTLGFELLFYAGVTVLFVLGLVRHTVWIFAITASATLAAALQPFDEHGFVALWGIWFTTMTAGMVVHDAWEGRLPRRAAWAVLAAGASVGIVATLVRAGLDDEPMIGALIVGYGLLATALALEDWTWPRVLLRIGVVSYSIYLTHELVLYFVPEVGPRAVTIAVWLAACTAVGEIGHRLVERPGMELCHRFSRSGLVPDRPASGSRAS